MLTRKLFDSIFPTKGLSLSKYNLVRRRDELINALNKFLPVYGITTSARIRALLATCGVETDYFKTSIEYASGADYEWRKDLGNFFEGDGKKFRGRSTIQTTGRFNYWRVVVRMIKKRTGEDWSHPLAYSNFKAYLASEHYTKLLAEADRLGVNFLAHPEMLADVEIAVEAACIFWEENDLNFYADQGRFKELNGIVNRGDKDKMPLHWSKRNELYSLCKRRIPQNFSLLANKEDNSNQQLTSQTDVDQALQSNKPDSQTNLSTPAASTTQTVSTTQAATSISAKDLAKKYLVHCPKDKIKNILAVIAIRILSGVTTVWSFGLSGQILLIVVGLIIAGCIVYALYYYSQRLLGWASELFDALT